MVNVGIQNKPSTGGRSILDYSLVVCFTLLIVMALLVLDAFEYITVPGFGGAKGMTHNALEASSGVDILSAEELDELQKKITEAKAAIAEKTLEVEKLVDKVEDEIKEEEEAKSDEPAHAETPAEVKAEEVKKEAVVEAIVKEELAINKFCGSCLYGNMAFTCEKRKTWMMSTYGLTEEVAIEAIIHKCGGRRRLRGI